MTDLGTLGGCCSEGRGINDAHQVVGGSATTAGFTNAVLWTVPGPHAPQSPASLAGEPGSASARPHPTGGGTGGTIPAARSKLDAFRGLGDAWNRAPTTKSGLGSPSSSVPRWTWNCLRPNTTETSAYHRPISVLASCCGWEEHS